MPNPFCSGALEVSFLCNATSGDLSVSQVQAMKDQAGEDVRKAAAGQQPAVVDFLVQKVQSEVEAALNTFALPGETGSDVGALPSQSGVRAGDLGNITLQKIKDAIPSASTWKWMLITLGAVVALGVVFPYVAPALKRNISAGRSLAA